jgi:hypothetical protein
LLGEGWACRALAVASAASSADAAPDKHKCEGAAQSPLTTKTAALRSDGGVGEVRPPAADGAGVLEQRLEGGREDRVAMVDGVLRIVDQHAYSRFRI